ncbi:MAG: hypothetical protein DMF20_08545 [Verrucomicrobia bacterium]|nr:MAG: hypothetical protein DMF20_08545 [Verrucomicrobiota bacterium]
MLFCSRRFFLSRTRLDASNGISASLSSLHDSDAGRYGKCSGERLEIRLRGGGKCSLSPKRHAFSPGGADFSIAEYYDRSCAWRRIVLVAFIIPLGILRNGFRILVIAVLCVNVGPQMIHSVIHRRGGPLFFALSLVPLLLLLAWLHKGEVRTRPVKLS